MKKAANIIRTAADRLAERWQNAGAMGIVRQMIPLLAAVVVLQLFFRYGVPYVWWDGNSLSIHHWPNIPDFWEASNQINLFWQISVNAILAFGITLTILIGGIDLSVGAVVALSGAIAVSTMTIEGNPGNSHYMVLGVLAALGAAAAFGLFNGLCAAKTRMPPFIVTLATMWIARGATRRFNMGKPITVPGEETFFIAFGKARIAGVIPVPVLVMFALFALAAYLLHRTRFGQHLYAMGGNREAARFTGVPLVRNEILVYMICSVMAGVAGLIVASQLQSASARVGIGWELNAIAAAVVGGTSFTGGKGTMIGTLIGAIIIGILSKGLNQADVHYALQDIVKGLAILAAVYIDVRRRR